MGAFLSRISVEIVVVVFGLLVFAPLLIALLALSLVVLTSAARTGILPGSVGVGSRFPGLVIHVEVSVGVSVCSATAA